jgi:hypothetical protein
MTPVHAQDLPLEGNFTILEFQQPALFEGILFDINATASLLTLPEYYKKQCRINTDFLLGEQKAEYDLGIENLHIRLDVLGKEYDEVILQKDLEITALQDALKKNSLRNPWLWGTLGVVIGASATVAIVETVRD